MISLRKMTLLESVLLMKPAVLLLGFGLALASWRVTAVALLVYGSFKVVEILLLKAVFEAIMVREPERQGKEAVCPDQSGGGRAARG